MDFIKQHTSLIFIAAIVLLGAFGFYYYAGSGSSDVLTASGTTIPEGQNILALLTKVQKIKLNDAIFSDPVFLSLTDFGTTLPPQPIGRTNPFAPLSGLSSGASTVTTQTATSSAH